MTVRTIVEKIKNWWHKNTVLTQSAYAAERVQNNEAFMIAQEPEVKKKRVYRRKRVVVPKITTKAEEL